jgi:fibronectin-binding autotransporter adhesin
MANTMAGTGRRAVRRLGGAVTIAACLLGSSLTPATAATYYWDTDGATPGFGTASGTWNSSGFWSTSPAGDVATAAPTITTADAVYFGTDTLGLGGGMVTVGSTGQGFGQMTFGGASGAVLVSSGSLQLASSSTIAMNATSGTIGSVLYGTGAGFTKVGPGTLALTGSNAFTGRTIVTEGTLRLASEVNLGSNPASFLADALTVTNGAIILADGTCTLDDTNRGIYLGAGGATIDSPANTRFTAGVPISGPGGIVKNGIRELVLSGSNSFAGGITINAGKVVFSGSSCEDNVPAVVMTGGTLSLSTAFNSGTATIGNLSGAVGSVIDTAFAGSNAIRTLSVAQSVSGTYSGQMTNATSNRIFSLVKAGSATLTLDGLNTYTGPTRINGGTLAIGSQQAIATSSTLAIASGALLDASAVAGGYVMPATQSLLGSGTMVGGLTIGGGATAIPSAGSGALTVTGGLTLSAGGNYNWQMLNATGTAGSGWGLISTDSLTLSGLSAGSPFNVNLWSLTSADPAVSGDAVNFSPLVSGSWRVLTSASTISGFDPSMFAVTTTATAGSGGFTNPLIGGSFSLALSADSLGLDLLFTPAAATPLVW